MVTGRFLGPLLKELRGGVAAQVIAATPVADPVAILVSPPSFRVHWLLARPAIPQGVVKIDAGQQNEATH